ncbi:uncharacterized protein LOC109523288 isoform X2 [Hippocampus comes]|uniref:uncharacterized protein LOC109523288 isoform X2 n=1 Tax=Hippocampus comes TaxID=109280 RepID=UPI00094ECFFD|nr:PREDICTED: uncharacterized protein LOC109523288 isoform X2 [Hippocampus comes]
MLQHWRDDETRQLLFIRGEEELQRQVSGTARDTAIYKDIAAKLNERGFERTPRQVINKLKALKRMYFSIKDNNNRSGMGRRNWPFYGQCNDIFGTPALANPVKISSSMARSAAPPSPTLSSKSSTLEDEVWDLASENENTRPRSEELDGEDSQARTEDERPETCRQLQWVSENIGPGQQESESLCIKEEVEDEELPCIQEKEEPDPLLIKKEEEEHTHIKQEQEEHLLTKDGEEEPHYIKEEEKESIFKSPLTGGPLKSEGTKRPARKKRTRLDQTSFIWATAMEGLEEMDKDAAEREDARFRLFLEQDKKLFESLERQHREAREDQKMLFKMLLSRPAQDSTTAGHVRCTCQL